MKCEELLRMLNDYVDGDLDPGLCDEFEKHFAGCNPCQVVVDTVRKTIAIYKGGQVCEIPIEFRQRLHRAIREKWKQVHPGPDAAPPPAP
jgi:anti-sigma factor RsiW